MSRACIKHVGATKAAINNKALTNHVFVNPSDPLAEQLVSVNRVVYKACADPLVEDGSLSVSIWQRECMITDIGQQLTVEAFTERPPLYLLALKVAPMRDGKFTEIKEEELRKHVAANFGGYAFTINQKIGLKFNGQNIYLTVEGCQILNDLKNPDSKDQRDVIEARTGILTDSKRPPKINIEPCGSRWLHFEKAKKGITLGANFLDNMGIGGLDDEFTAIFRRAFISRMFPADVIRKMGLKHAKGMLLYGPPGTGKTLIARKIGQMLDGREPIIINGPEILNKFVGESEKKMREAFEPAEQDQEDNGEGSDLHIIIFDEIDAICKQRGSSGSSTGVGDTVVNQLLTKMDGVKELNNVLVIGMTNRKDMIDSALLRPGRFEVHVEIGLPNEHGRLQIFNIHTKAIRDEGKLADDVDLAELARRTKNYSGAEIAGVIRCAASHALQNGVDTMSGGAALREDVDFDSLQVTMDHFISGMEEVPPAFGADEDDLKSCLAGGFIPFSEENSKLVSDVADLVHVVRADNRTDMLSVLLEGKHGVGKSALAAKIAIQSGFPYIKMIRPDDLIGMNDAGRVSKINRIFEDAYKSPMSVIILDGIERLIEYVNLGPRFSNQVLQALLVLLKKPPPMGRKLLIIGTTSRFDIFESLDLNFDTVVEVPHLTEAGHVRNVLSELKIRVDDAESARICEECPKPISIKKLLMVLELAGQDKSVTMTANRFMSACEECGLMRPSYSRLMQY